MKEFNYVDTDSAKVRADYVDTDSVKVSDEIRGVEHGLKIRAIRSLLAGDKDVDVTIGEDTIRATYEMPGMKTRIGDPLNGHYTTVFATTEEKTYLLVEINEFCNIVRAEFYRVE